MSAIITEMRQIADELARLKRVAEPNHSLGRELILLSDRMHTLSQRLEQILREFEHDPRD